MPPSTAGAGAANFRASNFDPKLLVAQILSMQSTYYAILATTVLFMDLLLGAPVSLDQLLHYRSLRGDTGAGWVLILSYLLTASMGYGIVEVVVVVVAFHVSSSLCVCNFPRGTSLVTPLVTAPPLVPPPSLLKEPSH